MELETQTSPLSEAREKLKSLLVARGAGSPSEEPENIPSDDLNKKDGSDEVAADIQDLDLDKTEANDASSSKINTVSENWLENAITDLTKDTVVPSSSDFKAQPTQDEVNGSEKDDGDKSPRLDSPDIELDNANESDSSTLDVTNVTSSDGLDHGMPLFNDSNTSQGLLHETQGEVMTGSDPLLSLAQSALQMPYLATCSGDPLYIKQEPLDDNRTSPPLPISFGCDSLYYKDNDTLPKKEAGKKKRNYVKTKTKSGSTAADKQLTDYCLVCSGPCRMTNNRKLPSLPFCKKCKKSYFYKLANLSLRRRCQNPDYSDVENPGASCVIYYKNPNNCNYCHFKKFQSILKASKEAFKTGSKLEYNESEEDTSSRYDKHLIEEALKSQPCVMLNKMAIDPEDTMDVKDMTDVVVGQKFISPPKMFLLPDRDEIQQEPESIDSPILTTEVIRTSHSEPSHTDQCLQDNPHRRKRGRPRKVRKIEPEDHINLIPSPSAEENVSGRAYKLRRIEPKDSINLMPAPTTEETVCFINPDEIRETYLTSAANHQPKEIPRSPVKVSGLRKVGMEDDDVKVFVLQCRHACSVCNSDSKAERWLKKHGYPIVDPQDLSNRNRPVYADPSVPDVNSEIYRRFVEFYKTIVASTQAEMPASYTKPVQPKVQAEMPASYTKPVQPKVTPIELISDNTYSSQRYNKRGRPSIPSPNITASSTPKSSPRTESLKPAGRDKNNSNNHPSYLSAKSSIAPMLDNSQALLKAAAIDFMLKNRPKTKPLKPKHVSPSSSTSPPTLSPVRNWHLEPSSSVTSRQHKNLAQQLQSPLLVQSPPQLPRLLPMTIVGNATDIHGSHKPMVLNPTPFQDTNEGYRLLNFLQTAMQPNHLPSGDAREPGAPYLLAPSNKMKGKR